MIRLILYLCAICCLCKDVESLMGENVLPAAPNEFPFIASFGLKPLNIHAKRNNRCGGSLITRQHVLTAAHCLENRSASEIDVIVGEQDLSIARFIYQVDWWLTYDDWALLRGKTVELIVHDVAIVKLTSIVDRPDVIPVTLTSLNDQRLYRIKAVIAGWGRDSSGAVVNKLHKVSVTIMTPEDCSNRRKMITNRKVQQPKNTLCSSAEPYALTTCGDSGGPLLTKNNILSGIVRSKCPKEGYYWGNFSEEFIDQYKFNIQMSVDYYREFIEDVTNLITSTREVLLDLQNNEILHGK